MFPCPRKLRRFTKYVLVLFPAVSILAVVFNDALLAEERRRQLQLSLAVSLQEQLAPAAEILPENTLREFTLELHPELALETSAPESKPQPKPEFVPDTKKQPTHRKEIKFQPKPAAIPENNPKLEYNSRLQLEPKLGIIAANKPENEHKPKPISGPKSEPKPEQARATMENLIEIEQQNSTTKKLDRWLVVSNENSYAKTGLQQAAGTINVASISSVTDQDQLIDWADYEAIKIDQKRRGPGEGGISHYLQHNNNTELMARESALYKLNGYNAMLSDYVSLNRSIKDARSDICKTKTYSANLPRTSIILPFHNEHLSVLLRSLWSIVSRTPKILIHEIILVDDNSTWPALNQELSDYLNTHLPAVKLIRTDTREGLVRARQIGARIASGEVNYNWLPPLLQPITIDYRSVTCPYIDIIDHATLTYQPTQHATRGSFSWTLTYRQLPMRPEFKTVEGEPHNLPVMAGGYFAISRKFFWELGGYDEGLDIWGGEQFELSFKIWQCDGKLLDVPCSHVGHIYRKHQAHPDPDIGDFLARNFRRVAEVWMDEFKQYVYAHLPHIKAAPLGDISKQLAVRERLQCKPFKWFMTHINPDQDEWYPAVDPDDAAWGHIRSLARINATSGVDTLSSWFFNNDSLCIDAYNKDNYGTRLHLSQCVENGYFQKHRWRWYRDILVGGYSGSCFDTAPKENVTATPVRLWQCHFQGHNQGWQYSHRERRIELSYDNLCLDCEPQSGQIFVSACNKTVATQRWEFEFYNATAQESWKRYRRPL